jgi:hypothetical protein
MVLGSGGMYEEIAEEGGQGSGFSISAAVLVLMLCCFQFSAVFSAVWRSAAGDLLFLGCCDFAVLLGAGVCLF